MSTQNVTRARENIRAFTKNTRFRQLQRGHWRGRALALCKSSKVRAAQISAAMEYGSNFYDKDARELDSRKRRKLRAGLKTSKSSDKSTQDESFDNALALDIAQQLPDFNEDGKHREFLKELAELGHNFDENQGDPSSGILELAKKYYSDPSYCHAALRYGAAVLNKHAGASKAFVRKLEELTESYHKGNFANIQAGYNMMRTAERYAKDGLGTRDTLANFYRERALGNYPARASFEAVVAHFGFENFDKGAEFLIKALGADLNAMEASADVKHLGSVLDDLYNVEVLGNVHRFLEHEFRSSEKKFGQKIPIKGLEVLQKLLDLSEKSWPESKAFTGIIDKSQLQKPEERIYLMNGLLDQTRNIPLKFYAEAEHREQLLSAAQEALDGEIAKED